MLENLVNFSLVFAISCEALLLYFLFRLRERMAVVQILAGLTTLLLVDQLVVLLLLNHFVPEFQNILSRGHLALSFAILGGTYDLVSRFTTARHLPSWRRRDVLVGLCGGGLAIFMLSGLLPETNVATPLPASTLGVALLTLYFIIVSGLVYWEIRQRYHSARDPITRVMIERVMFGLLPLSVFIAASFFVLPHLQFGHIFFFSTAMPLALVLVIALVRFQVIEIETQHQLLIPIMMFTSLLIGLFFLQPRALRPFEVVLLAIPLILVATVAGNMLFNYLQRLFQTLPAGYEEMLDKNVESFSDELGKMVTQQQLWAYLAEFYKENLQTGNVAIVTVQDDITPYQIAHLQGFKEPVINALIRAGKSQVMDRLELERQIVVRGELPRDSQLHETLEAARVALVIPLVVKTDLIGAVFIGGSPDGAMPPVSRKNLRVYRVISAQAAVALEKIRTLENMFQAQKMAGLGMFASQLAHDFRSFITLTRLQMKQNPNPRLEKHAIYMEKMVNDLLNYARPQELSQKPVDINQVIEMSLEMVDMPEHISVEKNFDRSLPKLMLDVSQMRRVFTNLFENSVRAMRVNESGRVKITTKPLRSISKRHPSPWVHVEILDDGVGIEAEYLERIFDPFFTTRKDEGGSGFGLAIVRQIISRHNGHIEATSHQGRGTVFNIRLPYQPGAENGQPGTKEEISKSLFDESG